MDFGSWLGNVDILNGSHLDSHADTYAGGSNFVLMDPTQIDGYVDVAPFSDEYSPLQDIPVATCVTAWTNPDSGKVFLLVFGQMLYFGDKLSHSLLCPNQMRANGLTHVKILKCRGGRPGVIPVQLQDQNEAEGRRLGGSEW